VELVTVLPQPIASTKTMMFFRATPADGLELYLGAHNSRPVRASSAQA